MLDLHDHHHLPRGLLQVLVELQPAVAHVADRPEAAHPGRRIAARLHGGSRLRGGPYQRHHDGGGRQVHVRLDHRSVVHRHAHHRRDAGAAHRQDVRHHVPCGLVRVLVLDPDEVVAGLDRDLADDRVRQRDAHAQADVAVVHAPAESLDRIDRGRVGSVRGNAHRVTCLSGIRNVPSLSAGACQEQQTDRTTPLGTRSSIVYTQCRSAAERQR